MRFLTLRPDDSELFQSVFDEEKQLFLLSNFQAFEQMWKEQGTVFWLRFLITFARSYEISKRTKGKFSHLLSYDGEKLQNCIFTYIHKHFVESIYPVVKRFMENMLVAAKHFRNLKEVNIMDAPFVTKDSREAFANIIGKPDIDDKVPFSITAFLCLVSFEFSSAVCVLLGRWLKATDWVEKEEVDAVYWQHFESWDRYGFYSTCFEQYLADYWGEDLSQMLLHKNVFNLFNEHEELLDCCETDFYGEVTNVFELFKEFPSDNDSTFQGARTSKISKFTDLPCTKHNVANKCFMKIIHSESCLEPNMCDGIEPCKTFCYFTENDLRLEMPVVTHRHKIKEISYMKPTPTPCKLHSKCFLKILHRETCPEPYLCYNEKTCKLNCETSVQNHLSTYRKNFKVFWEVIEVDIYSCKNGKRNVATLAQSSDKCIETHFPMPDKLEQALMKQQDLTYMDETLNFYPDPELMNSFSQHKKKQEIKNRLRTKLCKKYKCGSKNYEDPSHCMEFYRKAIKTWQTLLCQQNFQKMVTTDTGLVVEEESLFGTPISIQKAMTSIAVGTADMLGGRVFLCTGQSTEVECENETQVSPPLESQLRSKKAKKKKKVNSNDCNSNKPLDSSASVDLALPYAGNTELNIPQSLSNFVGKKEAVAVKTEKSVVKVDSNNKDEKVVDDFLTIIGVLNKPPQENTCLVETNSDAVANGKKLKLKVCAYCGKNETEYKTFKRCSRCKIENFAKQRYYCSRECQVDDWEESHREEHQKKSIQ